MKVSIGRLEMNPSRLTRMLASFHQLRLVATSSMTRMDSPWAKMAAAMDPPLVPAT
jgi:hypothetical protein